MKTRLLCLFTLSASLAFAQKNRDIALFLFKENWQACTKAEDAKFLAQRKKMDDTTYQWKYYHFAGPLVSIETSRDAEGTQPNGYMAYYGEDGKIDSSGHTIDGRKNGWWYYYTDSLTLWLKEKYNNGKLLEKLDTLAMRLERESKKPEWDSTDVLVEASFKGGDRDWMKYIEKKLKMPDRTKNIGKSGKMILSFMVDTTGQVRDIRIEQSLEYAIDEEATKLIEESPVWKPATINGKPVKAFRRQPLSVSF